MKAVSFFLLTLYIESSSHASWLGNVFEYALYNANWVINKARLLIKELSGKISSNRQFIHCTVCVSDFDISGLYSATRYTLKDSFREEEKSSCIGNQQFQYVRQHQSYSGIQSREIYPKSNRFEVLSDFIKRKPTIHILRRHSV